VTGPLTGRSITATPATSTQSTEVDTIPPISRDESTRLAITEYARFTDLVRQLGADDFAKSTDCTEWDVRTIIVHQVGAGEAHARWPEFLRQVIGGLRLAKGRELVDGLNDFHLRERADWSAERAIAALPDVQARAVRGRRRFPAALRLMSGSSPGIRRYSMGFLFDVILTRDTWAHRVDISRATGREMVLTAERRPHHRRCGVGLGPAAWPALPAEPVGSRRGQLPAGIRGGGDQLGRARVLSEDLRPREGHRSARPAGGLVTVRRSSRSRWATSSSMAGGSARRGP